MADATISEVAIRVGELLSVIPGGETLEAEDSTLIQTAITRANEKLRDMEICHWSDTAFPQSILDDLAHYVACAVVPSFRDTQEVLAFRQVNEERALSNLRTLTYSRERMNKPTRQEYF